MVQVGKSTQLRVFKLLPIGAILDDGDEGILLPKRYLPRGVRAGDDLDVFIYRDSEDRLIATTKRPKAEVGEVAYLQCTSVNKIGAFLDWGLPKDLLVPFKEQKLSMEEGRSYVVYLFLDEITDRIAASSKLEKYIDNKELSVKEGDEVGLIVVSKSELGYNVVINHSHWGLIYHNEIYEPVSIGQHLQGHIKLIREDQKVDVRLQAEGMKGLTDAARVVLDKLNNTGGFLALSDASSPDEIYRTMKMSKKSYKRAIGTLYKQRLIKIEGDGIRLLKPLS